MLEDTSIIEAHLGNHTAVQFAGDVGRSFSGPRFI
jgi:hypothetical protein